MKNFFLLFLVLLINQSFAQIKERLTHEDRKRTWLTYIPENYSRDHSYPLVIALHGGGGSAKQLMNNTRRSFNKLADSEDFIIVYPQGVKKSWNDNPNRDQKGYARKENIDDVGFIKKMILQLKSKYSINESAIFACGVSNGGLMSQTLAMELPEKIRAIGMVASNFGKNQINEFTNVKPFSILVIHGVDDPVFPYKEGEIGLFGKSRGAVLGVNKTIDYMCQLNGNTIEPTVVQLNDFANDDCRSEHLIYPNLNEPSLKIELIKVSGGGHTWPGAKEQRLISRIVGATTKDFDACQKLWSFFKRTMN